MYIAKDKEINLLFAESEKMYRHLVESIHNGIYMADAGDILFFVNQSFVEMLGYSRRDELLGLNIAQKLYRHPEERDEFLKEMRKTGFVVNYPVEMIRKDGTSVILSMTSDFIRNEQGKMIAVEGIVHDITEQKQLETRLQSEKLKLEEILSFDERVTSIRNLDRLVDFIVDKATTILEAEKCSLMLFDETSNELCIKGAKGLSEDVITGTRVKLGDPIAGLVAKEGGEILVKNIEYDQRFERKSRPGYRGRSFMSASIKLNDRLIGVVNVADKYSAAETQFSEVDLKVLCAIVRQAAVAIENAKLYRELEYLSVTDPLTNLWNYRCFVASVDDEIQRFKRFSSGFSLLMVDVDNFKEYNDTFGHLEGDMFLKDLGKLFISHLRVIDKVCRYGGDEFVILLPGTDLDHARVVGEKLRESVENYPFKHKMTVSIGVSEFKKPLSRFELLMRVDRALYQAKRGGRNRVDIYSLNA